MFRRNVGGLDRVLRVTLGPILFLAGLLLLMGRVGLGIILVVVGLLALLTGMVRFCVLYVPFGISTARSGESRMKQMCDCATWMREMQKEHDARSPVRSEVKEAETTTAGHSR
jgi:hypothetical protein